MKKQLTIFDTAICSSNLGDFIIMDAVKEQLNALFPDYMKFYAVTHDVVGKATYDLVRQSNYSFVGGTNLLSSNMRSYNQWKINLKDAVYMKDIILLGVGWWQYQRDPDLYTRTLFRRVLNREILHSVRDSFTEQKLHAMGLKNVINTACATMWKLTPEHCADIPKEKGEEVVFTLTDYNQQPEADTFLIDTLLKTYKKVYFWPQGSEDIAYFAKLNKQDERLHVLPPTLEAYTACLADTRKSLDFVGTRLHAGVRALQLKRRSLIIAIDNRAKEKAKDFNLAIIDRSDLSQLAERIRKPLATEIHIPQAEIERWKAQFV
ncbi:MAG: polysaccharide pyruvyl transferase family protein [Nitritalea sp.]